MTIEEKLQNFYDISMESARAESTREMKAYKSALRKIFKEHQENAVRQNDLYVKTETEESKRISNMEISREQLQMKREYSRKEEELTKKLFDETQEMLTAYKGTPEYLDWMKSQVRQAEDFARGAQMRIYIDPSDEALLPALRDAVTGEDVEVLISRETFGGGTRAVIHSRNILIDNSFSKRIAEVREHFQLRDEVRHIQ